MSMDHSRDFFTKDDSGYSVVCKSSYATSAFTEYEYLNFEIYLRKKNQEKLIAFVEGEFCPPETSDAKKVILVASVLVKYQSVRKLGIGTALMEEISSLAAENNCEIQIAHVRDEEVWGFYKHYFEKKYKTTAIPDYHERTSEDMHIPEEKSESVFRDKISSEERIKKLTGILPKDIWETIEEEERLSLSQEKSRPGSV